MDEKSPVVSIPLVKHSNDVRVLKDVKVPEKFFKRMCLGVQVLDEIFGGQEWPGILPGTSVLFTGMPGAGKSTAALQFADLLQRNAGRNILYNVGEESEYMIKMRADRIGIAGDFGVSVIEDVDDLIATCKRLGIEVLFQDSLQSLRMKGIENLSRIERLKSVTKKLHKFAKDDDVSVFIIGHITKGGDFAGPMEVKHDVDVHAHIRLNPDTMAREFVLTKNRFGPAGIPYEANLSAKGLDFAAMSITEQKAGGEAGPTRADERREAVDKIIMDALLAGDRVSAYCKDRLCLKHKIDCSGGFWRSRLERAKASLQAQHRTVNEVKIDGRTHYQVEAEL